MSKTQSKLGITIPSALNCCCWTQVVTFYSEEYTYGVLKSFSEGCLGGTLTWQFYNTLTEAWDNIPQADPGFGGSLFDFSLYDPFLPGAKGAGWYRIKVTETGCCDTYSNIIEVYGPV